MVWVLCLGVAMVLLIGGIGSTGGANEPTSALDPETEAYLVRALHEAAKDGLVVITAHRLSTIADADTIASLEDGRVLEQGSHDSLMADAGSHYHRFVTLQPAPVTG